MLKINTGHLTKEINEKQQIVYLFVIVAALFSKTGRAQTVTDTLSVKEFRCDDSLWNYVYMKNRLKIIEPCKKVTGVIVSAKKVKDRDIRILLKLDPGQEHLINKMSIKRQEGCLVLEPICAATVYRFFVGKACDVYVNKVYLSKAGKYVEVTGSYVKDG